MVPLRRARGASASADGNRGCRSPLRAKINEASGVSLLDVESSKAEGLFLMG